MECGGEWRGRVRDDGHVHDYTGTKKITDWLQWSLPVHVPKMEYKKIMYICSKLVDTR